MRAVVVMAAIVRAIGRRARKAGLILVPQGHPVGRDPGMMGRVRLPIASAAGELGAVPAGAPRALDPRDVGLPDSGRRRTPGLRREEVATLAGVSVDYLVRLEQGRDIHPSARGARSPSPTPCG